MRAIRPQDIEVVAAMQDLPGFRWGTMRLPRSSPEQVRNWIERTLPGSASLVLFQGLSFCDNTNLSICLAVQPSATVVRGGARRAKSYLTHDAGLPTHASTHQQAPAVVLKL